VLGREREKQKRPGLGRGQKKRNKRGWAGRRQGKETVVAHRIDAEERPFVEQHSDGPAFQFSLDASAFLYRIPDSMPCAGIRVGTRNTHGKIQREMIVGQ